MNTRLLSLDVFRGATVALMILVNNPGSWFHLYPPLAHAGWHGCTPTDLVFPFFLFAVGHALALVLPALRTAGQAAFLRRVALRVALIFALGLLLNAAPFVYWTADGALALKSFETLRLMGVLQRIALCFGVAALLVWWLSPRAVLIAAAALLAGYWWACLHWGDPADPYGLLGWFGTAVDRALLGANHLYRGEGLAFDPEGLASTPPAIAQVLLGWWAGHTLRRYGRVDAALLLRYFVAAAGLALLAYLWQLALPLNKKIWTPSYVLLSTALALAALATLMHALENRPAAAPQPFAARLCEAFGKNPLFIFVLAGLVPRGLALLRWPDAFRPDGTVAYTSPLPWLYQNVFAGLGSDPRLGSFLFACANLSAYAALALWLDRRRLYFRV
jgi:predicted acyltransferase